MTPQAIYAYLIEANAAAAQCLEMPAADLRGRVIALNAGSNVHYPVLRALQNQGMSLNDVLSKYGDASDRTAPPTEAGGAESLPDLNWAHHYASTLQTGALYGSSATLAEVLNHSGKTMVQEIMAAIAEQDGHPAL